MNVAVFSTNLSFFDVVASIIKNRGWLIRFWRETSAFDNGRQIESLLNWCDIAFIEFCQEPLIEVLDVAKEHRNKTIVARMHRIEVYNEITSNKNVDWSLIDILFVSSHHIVNKFMTKRIGMSKPSSIVVIPTNIIDQNVFKFVERKWEPPFRMCMIGSITPKKRQYTTIEYMYDVKNKYGNKFMLDIVGPRNAHNGYGNVEYFENCLDLIDDLNLRDIVTVYDPMDKNHLVEFLNREHIIISNSNEEGTHVSITEGAMTGCIPFVHTWRGAATVYPMTWHFKSCGEFINLCDKMINLSSNDLVKTSKEISDKIRQIYGDVSHYNQMLDYIETISQNKGKQIL